MLLGGPLGVEDTYDERAERRSALKTAAQPPPTRGTTASRSAISEAAAGNPSLQHCLDSTTQAFGASSAANCRSREPTTWHSAGSPLPCGNALKLPCLAESWRNNTCP